jgi:hypothetical protein
MALEKVVVNDKKEVVLNDEWNFVSIQVRVATIFREDGVDQSRNFHRYVLMPDADYSSLPADVVALCDLEFTQECKDNYQAFLAAQPTTP